MRDRSKEILKTAVEDFIKTGKPITSESLYDAYDFGIRPAMIRRELNDLSEDGYFYQNHPSGGRFPSDKAYKFLVGEILKDGFKANYPEADFRNYVMKFLKGEVNSFIEDISGELKMLSVGYGSKNNEVWTSGLYDLLYGLDVEDKEELVGVVRDFEMIPRKIKSAFEEDGENWPKVFIGKNPFVRSRDISVVADCLKINDDVFFILAIGPKRMDYAKPLGLFEMLNESIKK